jgi:hypothetical protein
MWIVTKEAVTAIVRTFVPYVYAALLGQVPFINDFLVDNNWADEMQGFVSGGFVVIVGTVVYAAIRAAAEKWPQLGYLLVINKAPAYDE